MYGVTAEAPCQQATGAWAAVYSPLFDHYVSMQLLAGLTQSRSSCTNSYYTENVFS
jgi:hypothetical protein